MWDNDEENDFNLEFQSGKLEIKSDKKLRRYSINGVIRTIHIYHYGAVLYGLRFYDKDGKLIYESTYKDAFSYSSIGKHEILLREGEKIVGFISKEQRLGQAWHCDFQFIVGSE